MNLDKIRKKSLKVAKKFGYPINKNLPLLDFPEKLRQIDEVAKRILSLNAVVACSFDPKDRRNDVKKWLEAEQLVSSLTNLEHEYIYNGTGDDVSFQLSVESVWCFVWIIGLIKEINFKDYCEDNLVFLLPMVGKMEPSNDFIANSKLRSVSEILEKLDLTYCLHWAIVHSTLNNLTIPGKVEPYVIEYRRKALEWLVSDVDWDDITLDT